MKGRYLLICLAIFYCFPLAAHAREEILLSRGETIYVPAYSHIYIGNHERPFLLTVTLSIRNIDLNHEINITSIDYYETQGKHLERIHNVPKLLKPLESIRYVISERDKSGGSGANFIVEWSADRPVNPPIVESIMIGARSGQGISFTSRGRVIETSNK